MSPFRHGLRVFSRSSVASPGLAGFRLLRIGGKMTQIPSIVCTDRRSALRVGSGRPVNPSQNLFKP